MTPDPAARTPSNHSRPGACGIALDTCRWTAHAVGDLSRVPPSLHGAAIPATVPGCIHTDLMDAGHLPDPAVGENEPLVQWVSWTDWRYETTFDADARLFDHHEIDLVFDHLDTIAAIEVNGDCVGDAANEFVPHRFSVLGLIKPGANRLAVTFKSPLRHVHEEAARLGARPVNGEWDPFIFIRKCASNFQWDWGPKVATCGIGGAVRLEAWSVVRIAGMVRGQDVITRVSTDPVARPTRLQLSFELAWSGAAHGRFQASIDVPAGDHHGAHQTSRTLEFGEPSVSFEIPMTAASRWWPTSQSARSLTRFGFRLDYVEHADPENLPLAAWTSRTALRGPKGVDPLWEFPPLPIRSESSPVFCQGANWIPEGLWPRDRTPERVGKRLRQLAAAGVNMLRVWGGGRYEPDWFYDLCDELGIMVWQDFMFSCACYPEEEPIRSLVDGEARHQVARLSIHPCVVLWCGGNECIWAHDNWGWKEKLLPSQTWGRGYYLDILPRIVAQTSGDAYLPNSPWSGSDAPSHGAEPDHSPWRFCNDPAEGDRHTWDVWGDGYRTIVPRFCSEFGQQSPSCWATLEEAGLTTIDPTIVPEPGRSATLVPKDLLARQRGPGGMERWYDQPLAEWFAPPRDFHEWHYLAQLLQARCMSIGIEWLRANQPICSGSLLWQANDAWPGLSWSVIDSAGRCKLAYAAMRQAHRPRLLTLQPMAGELQVIASNGADSLWESAFRLRRMSFGGDTLADTGYVPFLVDPLQTRSIARVEALVGPPSDPTREFVLLESVNQRRTWFYLPDRELAHPAPSLELEVEPELVKGEFAVVRIRAGSLLRDLSLLFDKLAPGFEQFPPTMHTLLAGETQAFAIRVKTSPNDPRSPLRITADLVRERRALWCANDFGRRE